MKLSKTNRRFIKLLAEKALDCEEGKTTRKKLKRIITLMEDTLHDTKQARGE